jgi:hypothetical protein
MDPRIDGWTTKKLRRAMDADWTVDEGGEAYNGGHWTGVGYMALITGLAGLEGAGVRITIDKYRSVVGGGLNVRVHGARVFALDGHLFNGHHPWWWFFHLHKLPDMSQHWPYQR